MVQCHEREVEDIPSIYIYIYAMRSEPNAMPVLSAPSAVREDEDNAEAQYIEYTPKKVQVHIFAFDDGSGKGVFESVMILS